MILPLFGFQFFHIQGKIKTCQLLLLFLALLTSVHILCLPFSFYSCSLHLTQDCQKGHKCEKTLDRRWMKTQSKLQSKLLQKNKVACPRFLLFSIFFLTEVFTRKQTLATKHFCSCKRRVFWSRTRGRGRESKREETFFWTSVMSAPPQITTNCSI